MISDILSDAVFAIDEWLNDEELNVYKGPIRIEIVKVRNRMEELRMKLDAPPKVTQAAINN